MAAIDKLYAKEYWEYNELRIWALIYYPELLVYFYDITLDLEKWDNNTNNRKGGRPIMNTPFKVDKKLKWICPLPFVREYLHEQCGVNPKREWLYRIFWKGKEFV